MTEIAIIGPPAAGKTTYLAALAHLSKENTFPGLDIRLLGDENSKTLLNMSDNLIILKDIVGQTEVTEAGKEPTYAFTIIIPAGKYGLKQTQKIKLSFVDYAGEIFSKISRRQNEFNIKSYINQLLKVEAWMVMLTDFHPGEADGEYQKILEYLCKNISREEQNNPKRKKLRIAIVMSKCERGEIWPGRLDPDEDLFKVRLPNTYRCLTENKNISNKRLRFFACSSFGVRDFQDPRPNRQSFDKDFPSEFSAVIRDDCEWKPYGLIAPLYWLSTGKVLSEPSL